MIPQVTLRPLISAELKEVRVSARIFQQSVTLIAHYLASIMDKRRIRISNRSIKGYMLNKLLLLIQKNIVFRADWDRYIKVKTVLAINLVTFLKYFSLPPKQPDSEYLSTMNNIYQKIKRR